MQPSLAIFTRFARRLIALWIATRLSVPWMEANKGTWLLASSERCGDLCTNEKTALSGDESGSVLIGW
jgi:hypothetical protein